MEIGKFAIAVFDSKSYDREYLSRASGADKLDLRQQLAAVKEALIADDKL